MQTRALGRTGLRVGELGLGTEHLSRELTNCEAVFDLAAASGVSYVDLLYNDPDAQADWWAAVLPPVQRLRDSFVIAAHWGWPEYYESSRDAACFERVLALLGGQAEVGMLTMVDSLVKWETWALPAIEALQAHKAAGRVQAVGLSSHYVATARLAIASGGVDVLMYPVHAGRHPHPDVRELLAEAAARGVALHYVDGVLQEIISARGCAGLSAGARRAGRLHRDTAAGEVLNGRCRQVICDCIEEPEACRSTHRVDSKSESPYRTHLG